MAGTTTASAMTQPIRNIPRPTQNKSPKTIPPAPAAPELKLIVLRNSAHPPNASSGPTHRDAAHAREAGGAPRMSRIASCLPRGLGVGVPGGVPPGAGAPGGGVGGGGDSVAIAAPQGGD